MPPDLETALDLIVRQLDQLRGEIQSVRRLIECELYGVDGHNGLKVQVAKNTEFRENFVKYRLALVGAVITSLGSLISALVRAFWGK